MEEFGFAQFDSIGSTVRKKRSQTSRRPKSDAKSFSDNHDYSSLLISDGNKASVDGSPNGNFRRKELNLNQCLSKVHSAPGINSDKAHVKDNETGASNEYYFDGLGRSPSNDKHSTEGVLFPSNWKNTTKLDSGPRSLTNIGWNGENQNSEKSREILDALGNENKVKKFKVKVGGITRTIHATSTSTKGSGSLEISRSQQRQNLLGNSEEDVSVSNKTGLQGVPWRYFSGSDFNFGKEDHSMGRTSGKNTSTKQEGNPELVRKSKRIPKRRVLDGEIDEDDADDEIRYLEKLKIRALPGSGDDVEESSKKHGKLSTMEKFSALRLGKEGKKSSSDRISEDRDYREEFDLASDDELDGDNDNKRSYRQKKEYVDSLMESKREMTLTTRQRALQSSKGGSSTAAANLIEFPDGLPPAPPRKQKEKLSEVELQLKKAEAAQKRRLQVEKAARESEAEAIRKILGQDSSRKKREEKIKKRQEELAQEKAANAQTLASSTVRWVSGPTGTTVTFSNDMGLPSILDSKPVRYDMPPLCVLNHTRINTNI
uniref:Uncharacterized protein LOC105642632 isoform X2 n=1 Tax=Rhizophora mucronata TaxID=61149 RepID=A0A2P2JCK5_RHIMU